MRLAMIVLPALALGLAGCEKPAADPAASASAPATATAPVASVSPEDAAKAYAARHEAFESFGKSMKTIGEQLKSGSADKAAIAAAASVIATKAPDLANWFPAGSGPDVVAKTEALPAIWEKPDEFRAAATRMAGEAARFEATAKAGDLAAIGAGMKELGGTCKGCHDKFRKPED